ncbi:MAG: hypothetical protein HXX10_07435 [Rhodoplanes sp.]|uniref:hypothetical protein n=1 Tax=Rhodoplanes sp. TaxID=1968906 RepID=UPI001797A25B|nr:hypothetical protein [Rhodoplanes sp.]NVO13852.1 hypothetical protein [Rhodoplanes sp.]
MIPTTVTVRCLYDHAPPNEQQAFVPFVGSPLAVTKCAFFDDATKQWVNPVRKKPWRITHVPTGFRLSGHTWGTAAEAMEVLCAADPRFAAWPRANGRGDDAATQACHYKFRAALGIL